MDQFEKKQANKAIRRGSQKEIQKWDAPPKGKKKGGKKACPGWIDHSRQPKKELTVPCLTCKRKFCSEECFESHSEFCEAKFYYQQTKDIAPLLELSKKTYDKYVGSDGYVTEAYRENDRQTSVWFLSWKHRDYQEAKDFLQKHEPSYIRKPPNGRIFF